MLLDQCPHCKTRHVQTQEPFTQESKEGNTSLFWKVLRCQNPLCKRLVLAVIPRQGQVMDIYPAGQFELEPSVPVSDEIREDFREAGLALGAGCYKASMVMSRRVLQRCLKEQGCTQHNLVDAIAYAIEHNILRKAFHTVAEEIRQYGNLGAHPDDEQLANANRENAEQVLEFSRLIIHDFYEVPATATKLRRKRQNPQGN